MPGFDGTGPLGQGPLTGRGMGFCNSAYAPSPYYYQYLPAPMRRFGRGSGRGFRRGFGRGPRFGRRLYW